MHFKTVYKKCTDLREEQSNIMKKSFTKILSIVVCMIILSGCSNNNKNNSNNSYSNNNDTDINTVVPEKTESSTGQAVAAETDNRGVKISELTNQNLSFELAECYKIAFSPSPSVYNLGSYDELIDGYLDEIVNNEYFYERFDEEYRHSLKDVDYDGDGIVDRIYRTYSKDESDSVTNEKYTYRIEFGNGIVTEVCEPDSGSMNATFYSYDIDKDGVNEILIFYEVSISGYSQGKLCVLKKYDNEYKKMLFETDGETEIFESLKAETQLDNEKTVKCYVPATGYSFEISLDDYSDITPEIELYKSWQYDIETDGNSAEGKLTKQLRLDNQVDFIRYEDKNALAVKLMMDIPVTSSTSATKDCSAILVFDNGKIKVKDIKEIDE